MRLLSHGHLEPRVERLRFRGRRGECVDETRPCDRHPRLCFGRRRDGRAPPESRSSSSRGSPSSKGATSTPAKSPRNRGAAASSRGGPTAFAAMCRSPFINSARSPTRSIRPPHVPRGHQLSGRERAVVQVVLQRRFAALTGQRHDREYVGLSWPSHQNRAGFLTVTATEDDTNLELTGSGRFAAGGGIGSLGEGKVKLAAGDVLQLIAAHDGPAGAFGADLSGTTLRASHPVQVIGGHSCANVPQAGTGYCNHLEQALFPVEVLGKDYLVTFPAAAGSVSPHVIRISAVSPETTVTFDPPIAAPAKLSPGRSAARARRSRPRRADQR